MQNEIKKQAPNPIFHEGYYYTLARKVSKLGQSTTYFHCRKNSRSYHCPATMKIEGDNENNIILLNKMHNHPAEEDYAKMKEFKETLHRMVMEHDCHSRGYLHAVYKMAAELHPDAALHCSYHKIQSTLRKWHHSRRANASDNEISIETLETDVSEFEMVDCGSTIRDGVIQIINEDEPPPLVFFNEQTLLAITPAPATSEEVLITPDLDHPYAEQPIRNWEPGPDERITLNESRLLCVICDTFVKKYRLECGHLFCGACAARIYTQNKSCFICHQLCAAEPQIIYL